MMQPNLSEKSEFSESVIAVDRVARVVAGGRRFRFRALVVVGDGKGKVGMAVAKASEVSAAVNKASAKAKQQAITIPLYRHGTIPHLVTAKFAGAKIMLKPAGPGTGVIAGGTVRQILVAAGVSDVLSKSYGSTNKLNTSYATFRALLHLTMAPKPDQAALATKGKPS